MKSRKFSSWILMGALALGVSACVKRSEIDTLKADQKALADRVAQLERNPTRPGGIPGAQLPEGAADQAPGEPSIKPAPLPMTPDATAVYAIPLGGSAVRGPKDAWVTVVMFSDYQCPFCARADETLQALAKKYPSQVRFVMKHNPLPFHPRAMAAAMAAECAGKQEHFWAMHDQLMAAHGRLDDQDMEKMATKAGLKMAPWRKCIAQAEPKDAIVADQKISATFGARGTPAFFINGHFLSGAQPQPVFEGLIEQELKRAKDSGIKAPEYYAKAVVAGGKQAL
jgi:protein-disulfide isomerase